MTCWKIKSFNAILRLPERLEKFMLFYALIGYAEFSLIAVHALIANDTVAVLISVLVEQPEALSVNAFLRLAADRRRVCAGDAVVEGDVGVEAGAAIVGEIASGAVVGESAGEDVLGGEAVERPILGLALNSLYLAG